MNQKTQTIDKLADNLVNLFQQLPPTENTKRFIEIVQDFAARYGDSSLAADCSQSLNNQNGVQNGR